MQLWQILVPTVRNCGRPFRLRHHRVWDKWVRDISGGLTVFQPVKGTWVAPDGSLFTERMIPVLVACTREQIERVADFTAKHYQQLAVAFWKVSDEFVIKNYELVDKLAS